MAISEKELQDILAKLTGGHNAIERRALAEETRLIAAFHRAQAKMFEKLSSILADAPNFGSLTVRNRLKWYLSQVTALNDVIKTSGYSQAVRTYLSSYDAFGKLAEDLMKSGRIPPEFTRIPKSLIRHIQQEDSGYFNFLNREATEKLDRVFLDGILSGVPNSQTLAELQGVITGSYKWGTRRGLYEWHAGTYARTAHFRATRTFMQSQASQVEPPVEDFIYIGPVDSKTRPFCQDRVGNVYTNREIEDMDNGQTGLVFSDGGGFNCRHDWDPVDKEIADAIRKDPVGSRSTVVEQVPKSPPDASPARVTQFEKKKGWNRSTPKDFKKAGSIADAEAFARTKGLGGESISYKGLDLKAANALNERIMIHLRNIPKLKEMLRVIGNNKHRALVARTKMVQRAIEQANARRPAPMTGDTLNVFTKRAEQSANRYLSRTGVRGGQRPFASFWQANDAKGITLEDKFFGATKKFPPKNLRVVYEVELPNGERVFKSALRLKTHRPGGLAQAGDEADIFVDGKFVRVRVTRAPRSILENSEFELQDQVASKWFVPGGGTVEGTIDHELGHALDQLFGIRGDTDFRAMIQSLVRDLRASGKEVADVLSRYGGSKLAETIAEGWAEYMATPTPRPWAKAIGEFILKKAGLLE